MNLQKTGKLQSVVFLLTLFGLLPELAIAQADAAGAKVNYTLPTICGNYGATATYGANIARALGYEIMDGQGKITSGAAIVNQPGPDSTRTIANIGIAGTYTVNPDGLGKMVLTITLPGGSTAGVTEDFVITRVKVIDGVAIASEIQDAQEEPSAVIEDTSLVYHTYTLRSVPKSCTRQ